MFDQPAANYWPDGSRNRAETRPGTDGAATFVLRKRTADDCETARNEQRRAEPLGSTRYNQLSYAGSKSTPGGRHSEKSHAN